jgi:hypothetical protein
MVARALTLIVALLLSPFAAAHPAAASPASPVPHKQFVLGRWAVPGLTPARAAVPASHDRGGDQELWMQLVFSRFVDGSWDVYRAIRTQDPLGGTSFTTVPLVTGVGDQITPRLSPDLSKLLYVSNRDSSYDIRLAPFGGGEGEAVASSLADDIQPTWAPDGQRFAFVSSRDGNAEIYVASVDGSFIVRLTTSPAFDYGPSWSPDGRSIAWASRSDENGAVMVMDVDGGNQRVLRAGLRYLGPPAWSPDGSQIAFDYDGDGDGLNRPAVMAADGSGFRDVALDIGNDGTNNFYDVFVNGWSPEGERLVGDFIRYRPAGDRALLDALFAGRMYLNGGVWSPLITPSEVTSYPDARSTDLTPPVSTLSAPSGLRRAGPVLLRLESSDVGIAGLHSFDYQYRLDDGPWQNLASLDLSSQPPTATDEQTYTGVAGTTVQFRARARDDAGNSGLFTPATPRLTFFTSVLTGRVVDNRGGPTVAAVAGLGAAVTSTPPDAAGRFHALLAGADDRAVSFSAEGFTSPPAIQVSAANDRTLAAYLLPADNLLAGGGFEAAGLGGWTAGGATPPTRVTGDVFTGAAAVRLGSPCAEPCFGPAEMVTEDNRSSYPNGMAVSADGTAHFIYKTYNNGEQLLYRSRSAAGVLSARESIVGGSFFSNPYFSAIAAAADGSVHVIVGLDDATFRHFVRSPQGSWSSGTDLGGGGGSSRLLALPGGRMLLLYECYAALICPGGQGKYYRSFNPGAGWSSPVLLPGNAIAALGPDSEVYLVGIIMEGMYLHKLTETGAPAGQRMLREEVNLPMPSTLVVDSAGALHIFAGGTPSGMYFVCQPDLECAPTRTIDGLSGPVRAVIDGRDVIHLFSSGDRQQTQSGVRYQRVLPSGTIIAAPSIDTFRAFALDSAGRAHLFTGTDYRRTQDVPAGESTLTRTVAIPAAMHRPTLSFAYSLARAGAGSRLEVRADDGSGAATILTRDAASPWGVVWADLTPYAGKSVTLTLALVQAAGAPPAELLVDDVALGSWRTPVVAGFSPSRIEGRAPATLTLTGENFIGTPRVLLGDRELQGVRREGDTTLSVTVPAGLKPGLYRITVINEGGQRVAADGLTIGTRIFLPLSAR